MHPPSLRHGSPSLRHSPSLRQHWIACVSAHFYFASEQRLHKWEVWLAWKAAGHTCACSRRNWQFSPSAFASVVNSLQPLQQLDCRPPLEGLMAPLEMMASGRTSEMREVQAY